MAVEIAPLPSGATELTTSMVVVPEAATAVRWKTIVTRLPAAELVIGVALQIVTPIWPDAASTVESSVQPLPEAGTLPR